jgi:spoIIIJ-associated protein
VTDTDVAGSAGDTDRAPVAESEVTDASGATEAGALTTGDAEPVGPGVTDHSDLVPDDDADDESADLVDDSVEEANEGADEDDDDEGADDEGADDEGANGEGDGEAGGAPTGRRSRRGGSSLRRLEEEGEVAADYLEELLDITDLDGDIDIDVENGRASVAVVSEDGTDRELRRLVGTRGEVLEALQELSRLAVQAKTGERSRLMLDIAGFRAARRRALEEVAARVCQEVVRGGQPVRMDPMSAFERKVVHDVVADAGLRSESEGEEPGRRVVVFPAGS